MWNENNKKLIYVYIKIRYENPPPPPPSRGALQNNRFLETLSYICLFALKILGQEKIMRHQPYAPPEFHAVNVKGGIHYLDLSQWLRTQITLIMPLKNSMWILGTKLTNMRLVFICNNPLNSKLYILLLHVFENQIWNLQDPHTPGGFLRIQVMLPHHLIMCLCNIR